MENKNIKDFYNLKINQRYNNNYEFNRWFRNFRVILDYTMIYRSIIFHIKDINFKKYIEIGPGPGTWTKIFYKKNITAEFDLIDISEEMKNQFILEMRDKDNINYFIKDINTCAINDCDYDIMFSSRAIEYFEDKNNFILKIYNSMRNNSNGIIITKNPFFGFRKNKKEWQHQGQISHNDLYLILKKHGFKNIKTYPIVFRLPLFDKLNLKFSERVFNKFYKKQISNNTFFLKFIESYLIKFEK